MSRISVIIPFYNSNLFLFRKCIYSILNQTYSDIEVIVVVDGSNIDYSRIKEYYEKKDCRIRFFEIEHAGVSAARNYGIEKAKGDYISFVDSDDFLEPIFLQELLQEIKGYDIAICGVAEQHFPTVNMKIDMKVFASLPAEYNYLQYTNFSVNKLYKRTIIEKHHLRFEKGIKLGEDALFLAEYFKWCKKIAITSKQLYHYVPNASSATKKYESDYWKWERNVISTQWNLFNAYNLTDREKNYMYAWLYHKFASVFNYYYYNDKKYGKKYIQTIMKNKLFEELIAHHFETGEFWNKKMINTVKRWKRFREKYYVIKRMVQR